MEKLSDKLLKRLEDWRAKVANQQLAKKPERKNTNFVSRKDYGDELPEDNHDNFRV
jgi:hypothetical protein